MSTENESQGDNLPSVSEPTITFKTISERDVYKVVSEDNADRTLIEITGYGLQINFNMQYLRSYQNVVAASKAVGEMFQEIMLEKLLEYKQTK